jgi:exodeoxyribonuclease VII small subunit
MNKKKITYREAVSEIEKIISMIENEELDVDELSDNIRKATELLNICKEKLFTTENEVEKILREFENKND